MHDVALNLNQLSAELTHHFRERENPIEACMLALVSGQHVFLLGPPGTAKTQLIRAIKDSIHGARYFEIGLSRNRPPEAVMGPLDIIRYRETGDYVLKRKGFASDSELILLNEVGKMSDDLGHDMLALLNERLIHEVSDGLSAHRAPLSTAFCDSNEMLTEGTEDAAALWDRLLYRDVVDYVQDESNFAKVLAGGEWDTDVVISWSDLKDAIDNVVPHITIDQTVLQAMVKLRKQLAAEGVIPSTRRFRQSMDALRAAAFLAGRDEVTVDDVAALRFTLWDTLDQIEIVARICRSAVNPFVAPLIEIRKKINEVKTALETRRKEFEGAGSVWSGSEGTALQMFSRDATKKLGTARDELDTMLLEASGKAIPDFKAVSDLHHWILLDVFVRGLDQVQGEAERMASSRLGSGDGGNV